MINFHWLSEIFKPFIFNSIGPHKKRPALLFFHPNGFSSAWHVDSGCTVDHLLSLLLFLQTDRLLFLFFLHAYNTLLPFAVNLNLAPSTSAAFLHIIILPRKISKYSYIVQISSSICKFNAIRCFCAFTFTAAFVTA